MLVPRRWILPVLGVLIRAQRGLGGGPVRPGRITGISVGAFHFAIAKATYAPLFFGAGLAIRVECAARALVRSPGSTGFRAAAPVWFAVVLGVLSLDWGPLAGIPNFFVHLSMTLMLGRAGWCARTTGWRRSCGCVRSKRIGQGRGGSAMASTCYHLFALTIMGKLFRNPRLVELPGSDAELLRPGLGHGRDQLSHARRPISMGFQKARLGPDAGGARRRDLVQPPEIARLAAMVQQRLGLGAQMRGQLGPQVGRQPGLFGHLAAEKGGSAPAA